MVPISIDVHVHVIPLYKKSNQKKTPIFFSREFFTLYRGANSYIPPNFLNQGSDPGQGAVKKFKCPQFTKVQGKQCDHEFTKPMHDVVLVVI